jgi:hypothetical protein
MQRCAELAEKLNSLPQWGKVAAEGWRMRCSKLKALLIHRFAVPLLPQEKAFLYAESKD